MEGYIFLKVFLALRNFGMDFLFSGNNGNSACALHLKWPVIPFFVHFLFVFHCSFALLKIASWSSAVKELCWTLIFTLRIFQRVNYSHEFFTTCEEFARIRQRFRTRLSHTCDICYIGSMNANFHIARDTPKKVAFLLHTDFSHVFHNLFNNFVNRKF